MTTLASLLVFCMCCSGVALDVRGRAKQTPKVVATLANKTALTNTRELCFQYRCAGRPADVYSKMGEKKGKNIESGHDAKYEGFEEQWCVEHEEDCKRYPYSEKAAKSGAAANVNAAVAISLAMFSIACHFVH
mmetsp:Transcript_105415/g.183348  ORF Transcript_105415/g.183348 Transcript_105415/m.183348 type:complete len:133 (-) Transcript_105415:164-562(-)